MSADELTQGVQFTIDQSGQVTAVVVTPDLWKRIVEALEDADDRELARTLRERLAAGPQASGALRWRDVADEWQCGGLEPNLDLLLGYLLLGTEVQGTQRVLLNLSAERTGLGQPDPQHADAWRARALARLLVTDAHRRAPTLFPRSSRVADRSAGTSAGPAVDRALARQPRLQQSAGAPARNRVCRPDRCTRYAPQ